MFNKNTYISSYTSTSDAKIKAQRQELARARRVKELEDPKAEVSLTNVKKYITAELSLQLYGPVTDAAFAARSAECMKCEHRFASADLADEIGFCRACGCGVSSRSRLSIKLTMPESTCPKNKWATSAGQHHRTIDRVKSWLLKKIIG